MARALRASYAGAGCPSAGRARVRHDAVVVALAGKLSTPFSRYSLSGFVADFGDGIWLGGFRCLRCSSRDRLPR